jgi:LRR receptor-like serine/threonine-protein kinase FLS2
MTAYSRAGSLKKSSSFRDLELSNDITGSIPSTVGRLQNLQRFYVMNNSLHGSIPNEFCYLRSTGVIALSKNGISGSIAPCLGGSFHSKRPVSGHPITIGVLQNLPNLSLSHKKLQGQIPVVFGELKGLEYLDLPYNNSSAMIPTSLKGLLHLEYLIFLPINYKEESQMEELHRT